MADNRIYLRNKITGEMLLIGKHYSNNWNSEIEEVDDFFKSKESAASFLESEFAYEIYYEINV